MKKVILFVVAVLSSLAVMADKVLKYDLEHHFNTSNFFEYLGTRTTPPMLNEEGNIILPGDDGLVYPLNVSAVPGGKTAAEMLANLGEDRLADMDSAGIDVAVISSSIAMYVLDSADAIYWCKVHNDSAYAFSLRHSDRIIPTMTLPVLQVDSAIAEMQRCKDMGMNLWATHSNFGLGQPRLYDPMFEPLLAKAEELGVSVYLHPDVATEPTLRNNGWVYATAVMGYSQDVMKTLVRMTMSGVFDRYPRLRVIVGHYGEWLPYTMERMDHIGAVVGGKEYMWQKDFAYYFRHRNIMITTSGIVDPSVYRYASKRIGATNIMFGSDYPYEDLSAEAKAYDTLAASVTDKEALWSGSACKYVITNQPDWTDTVPATTYEGTRKTPSVTGYDFEHHYYILPFFDSIATRTQAPYYIPETNTAFLRKNFSIPIDPTSCTFQQPRIDAMDEASIDVAVISSSEGPCEVDEQMGIHICRMSNDSVYAMSQRFPGRVMGEMLLPVQNIDSAIAEMERCYQMGFRVWCAASNYALNDSVSMYIYEDRFLPLLQKAADLGVSVYVHPQLSMDQDMQDFGYAYAAAILGFTMDVMRTVTRIVMNGTLDNMPGLRLIVPHMGEYFPYVMDRMDNRLALNSTYYDDAKQKRPMSQYFLDHQILISTSGNVSADAFELAKEVIGVDGIVYSSDYPYEDYSAMTDLFFRMDLTQEQLDQIWGGNAEKYILTNLPSDLETMHNAQCKMQNAKFFQNGQLLILRNGQTYNAQGIQL